MRCEIIQYICDMATSHFRRCIHAQILYARLSRFYRQKWSEEQLKTVSVYSSDERRRSKTKQEIIFSWNRFCLWHFQLVLINIGLCSRSHIGVWQFLRLHFILLCLAVRHSLRLWNIDQSACIKEGFDSSTEMHICGLCKPLRPWLFQRHNHSSWRHQFFIW